MYKLCKTEQSAKRQRQLEQGLLSMMTSTQYEQISVSDLCDHMQVPRKSFYRYFASKDGALHALIDHTLMEYEGINLVYRRGEKRTILLELTQFFQFWRNKKDFLDALQKSRMSGMLVERSMAHATVMNGVPPRFLPNDPPEVQRQVILFCVSGLLSMVLSWHRDGYVQSPEQMARIATRLLDQPLFPNLEHIL
jgi:AcrR family transcriptional regulator